MGEWGARREAGCGARLREPPSVLNPVGSRPSVPRPPSRRDGRRGTLSPGACPGGSMLTARCALLAALLAACRATSTAGDCPALLAACGATTTVGHCQALDVPENMQAMLPGSNINLTCPRNGTKDLRPVHWEFHSTHDASAKHGSRAARRMPTLMLRSVQPRDSGNYSCFRDGRLAGTMQLLVEKALTEEPQLSCFRKSFVNKVTCEWKPKTTPSPTTKATLLVKKLQDGGFSDSQQPCLYNPEMQTFSCQLPVPEGDNSIYVVSLCLANTVRSRSSKPETFQGNNILQPDPPANITVTAIPGNPRWLQVRWQDPPSWNSRYYRLKFELRYRAERPKTTFTTWKVPKDEYSSIIRDAWSGLSHVVQLRTQEEFGLGRWSPWSPEVRGTPWTEPRTSPVETSAPQSVQALKTEPDEEIILPVEAVNTTSLPVQDASVPLPMFLVAGGSLVFGMLLCVGIILRFKKTWKLKAQKETKTNAQPPYSPGKCVPEAAPVLVPLISPMGPPSNLGPDGISGHSQLEAGPSHSPYDVSNRDYFFPR